MYVIYQRCHPLQIYRRGRTFLNSFQCLDQIVENQVYFTKNEILPFLKQRLPFVTGDDDLKLNLEYVLLRFHWLH